jgi:1,4-dihydroxy-2-naphthoyl-CoA synthase
MKTQRPVIMAYQDRLGTNVRKLNLKRETQLWLRFSQGHAIGGGFGLMQACDLRVVMHDALLFFPEVDLGSGPVRTHAPVLC